MTTPRPERRPGITRRHPARAAAEAAIQAEDEVAPAVPPAAGRAGVGEQPQLEETAHGAAELEPADTDDAPTSAGCRAAERRLSSGRVSYAGKAVTIYFPTAEDKDRAQAAFAARGGMEGYTSASEWMADVILERTQQWENDYNGGRPFTDVLARREARRRRRA